MNSSLIYKVYILLFLISNTIGYSQDSISVNELKYNDYLDIVKKHHPISTQANLTKESGAMLVRKARGAFDPTLEGGVTQKYFDDKKYYSYLNAGLEIPTWYGVTLNGGYNNNEGTRLSNESYTPSLGLWNAGIEVNLGQGLFIDQRRADLKQAKIFENSTELEQRLMINKLLFDASTAYFEWYNTYLKVILYEDAVTVALDRLDNTKQSAILGDKPFVDTLKAYIQLQDRSVKLEANKLKLQNKRALLNTYLWQNGNVPLQLKKNTIPEEINNIIDTTKLNKLSIDSIVNGHPEILIANNNIEVSRIDYRLKRDKLKPKAKLKYNALSAYDANNIVSEYNMNDYNWGASISYPLFTRKERANSRLAKIKYMQAEAKQADKKATVEYKVIAAYNNKNNLIDQLILTDQMVNSYTELYDAELKLFNIGESSMFLVNLRDQNRINAELKYINMAYDKLYADVLYKYQTFGF